jgi:hypothetical protein
MEGSLVKKKSRRRRKVFLPSMAIPVAEFSRKG